MEKEPEMIMVLAATKALEYKTIHRRAETEEVIKHIMKSEDINPDLKLYAVVAANEVMRIKKDNFDLTDKQIMQEFVNNIFEFVAKVKQQDED